VELLLEAKADPELKTKVISLGKIDCTMQCIKEKATVFTKQSVCVCTDPITTSGVLRAGALIKYTKPDIF